MPGITLWIYSDALQPRRSVVQDGLSRPIHGHLRLSKGGEHQPVCKSVLDAQAWTDIRESERLCFGAERQKQHELLQASYISLRLDT